jgi:hypothetical protein
MIEGALYARMGDSLKVRLYKGHIDDEKERVFGRSIDRGRYSEEVSLKF